jgi:hypothetical protein
LKKNLIIALAVLVIAAMAIPASAAQLIFSGELNAKYTHTFTNTEEWTFADAAGESYLNLNLEFHEGENIVAFLPLTIEGFITPPSISVGNWYAAFNSQPWSFWVSNNDDVNPYHFEPLGDPMGIVAVLDGEAVINAAGPILGAEFNIYAADLGTDVAEVVIPDDPETPENEGGTDSAKVELGNAFVGRATYQLPIDFTIGLVGAYTNGSQRAVPGDGEAEVVNDPDHLTLGLDVSGVIPGLGANLVVAAAAGWEKVVGFDFDGESAAYAYMVKVSDIIVGPVKAWASYTAVDPVFNVLSYADKDDSIVAEYAASAAAEVEAEVSIPVGFPLSLTLGNGLWMEYPPVLDNDEVDTDGSEDDNGAKLVLDYDEVYAKLVGEPLEDLIATISGAYKFDLTDGSEDDNGWKVHGDVEYTVFGLTLNPYADYKVGSYAKTETDGHVNDRDTIVGMTIEGSPIGGLTIEAGAEYTFEEMYLEADAYAAFVTEANPGFVKSAKTTIAGLVLYELDLDMVSGAAADDGPELEWYAFAGTELGITDAVDAKLGILAKDDADDDADGIAASASVDYRVSETLSAGLIYTYRQNGPEYPEGYAGWLPFATSESNHYVLAKVTSKIGASTLTIAYGVDGLGALPTSGVHKGKPWAYLKNAPTTPMYWDLLSITVKVPF